MSLATFLYGGDPHVYFLLQKVYFYQFKAVFLIFLQYGSGSKFLYNSDPDPGKKHVFKGNTPKFGGNFYSTKKVGTYIQ